MSTPFAEHLLAEVPASRVRLSNVDIDCVTEADTCERMLSALRRGQGGYVVTVNVDHLVRCRRSAAYLQLVKNADLVVADGMPLIWASKLLGQPFPERVAGSTLCWTLSAKLARESRSVFLLGGNEGVGEKAARELARRFPNLRIAGTYCPPFGFEKMPEQMQTIREQLSAAKPDVVYVALGSPKQEELIDKLYRDFPSTWWLGVGISLSFISGEVKRAPRWLQAVGLEWAHRLVQEPKRLYRRYLIDGLPFVAYLLASSNLRRYRSMPR